jgi:hypothetical protein
LRSRSGRTMGPAEVFARSFERFLLFAGRHGDCRVHRNPDLFDGKAYSPDAFFEATAGYFDRPWDFFVTADRAPAVHEATGAPGASRRTYRMLSFPSPLPSGYPENDVVPFKWFEGKPRSRAVVLFAPGWPRQGQSFEERFSAEIAAAGVDVALLTVPFHQARTPSGAYSGEYFISSNVLWTVANFRQFVAEIRLLVRWMRERYDYIGLLGMSSGGVQAGLANLCEDVDFYFPLMSACDLGGLMWTSSITKVMRGELEAAGIDAVALEKMWSICDLAVLGKQRGARFCKQYLTRFDGIIPPPFQMKLWEVLGKPPRRDLAVSHFSVVFALPSVARDLGAFVRRCVPLDASATFSTPAPAPEAR